jgi:hypothetical protein
VPTDEQVDQIVELAGVVLDAYRPGKRLYDALNPALDGEPEGELLLVEIEGTSRNLRYVTAALSTVQLAFDAAAVAVLYRAEVPDQTVQEPDIELLQSLARRPMWTLEIEEFGTGSFRVKLRGLFSTRQGRTKLLAVAGVAAAILVPIVPGVAATALIIIDGLVYANEAFGDALDKVLDRHLRRTQQPMPQDSKERVQALHRANVERNRARDELAKELDGLGRDAANRALASVDRESLAAAGVKGITIEVNINLQPAA